MQVYKFGGASVRDAASIRNVAHILVEYRPAAPLVVVVSAMGKTTNALETVVHAYYLGDGAAAREHWADVQRQHYATAVELLGQQHEVLTDLNDLFEEVNWVLEDEVHDTYDYLYDQIVSIGELASTRIVAAYLATRLEGVLWQDVRDVITTDSTYREGRVQWERTRQQVISVLQPQLDTGQLVVTQGFIASTDDNQTTTLGREGSDFTAAILSHCLDAEEMTVWKDVPGILTADPRLFKHVTKLEQLSYREAIEMTYYGAQVIHPKTIKPLQNKHIPMRVRSFVDPTGTGTRIHGEVDSSYPPIVVVKPQQVVLHISTRDFSFVAEHHLSRVFAMLTEHRIKMNLMQNTAISFTISVDDVPDRLPALIADLEQDFNVTRDDDLELVTVRHYTRAALDALQRDRVVQLEERIGSTIQLVMKPVPVMERIG